MTQRSIPFIESPRAMHVPNREPLSDGRTYHAPTSPGCVPAYVSTMRPSSGSSHATKPLVLVASLEKRSASVSGCCRHEVQVHWPHPSYDPHA